MDLSRIVHNFPSQWKDYTVQSDASPSFRGGRGGYLKLSKETPAAGLFPYNRTMLSHYPEQDTLQEERCGPQSPYFWRYTVPRAERAGQGGPTRFCGEQQNTSQQMGFKDVWSCSGSTLDDKLEFLERLQLSRLTKGNTYGCAICWKKFRRKSDLTRHLCIHLDIRPYRCNTCSRNFVQKGSLKIHMQTHEKHDDINPSMNRR